MTIRRALAPLTIAAAAVALALAPPASAVPGCPPEDPYCDPQTNTPPEVWINGSATVEAVRNQSLTFTADGSDEDGDSISYAWEDDGNLSFDDGVGSSHSVSFPAIGSYTVKVRGSDGTDSSIASVTVNVVNRQETAGFTYAPAAPKSGESITFTSTSTDPDGDPLVIRWDLDGDTVFEATGSQVTKSFARGGTYTVTVNANDGYGGTVSMSKPVVIANRAPEGAVSAFPVAPLTGEQVTFDSAASDDPDGDIAARAWDLDGDGEFDDGAQVTASRSFARAGTYTVKLRLTDDQGAETVEDVAVTVANRAPTASFSVAPAAPVAGELVTFDASGSSDPEPGSPLTRYEWDLDGDGTFETDTGAVAQVTRTFDAPGTVTVALRVTDADGGTHAVTRSVTVTARPAPVDPGTGDGDAGDGGSDDGGAPGAPATPVDPGGGPVGTPRIANLVQTRWVAFRRYTKVLRLRIKALPAGTTVTVACKGRGCSFKRKVVVLRDGGTADLKAFFRKRRARAGSSVTIAMTRPGTIGRRVTYRFRAGRLPKVAEKVLPAS